MLSINFVVDVRTSSIVVVVVVIADFAKEILLFSLSPPFLIFFSLVNGVSGKGVGGIRDDECTTQVHLLSF